MKSTEKLTLTWLLRHPLVATCILLTLTILLPYLRVGERLKLLTFLPLAHAQDDVVATDPDDLSEGERVRLELKNERERAAALLIENRNLRQALEDRGGDPGFAEQAPAPAVDAQVLVHGDAGGWRHSCTINRGTMHGVAEGMPVVSGRTLVGRVYMAGERHACVQLITDPGFACSCRILGEEADGPGVRGVLKGDGSARPHFPRLELEDVTAGAEVDAGMRVVTSDYTGQFPAGLLVGVVRETIPQAGFLQVRIEASLDLASLDVVQVLQHTRPDIEQQAVALQRKR
jgi:rod shape-determining protein MreC